jgi:phenylpyruvate tautomerase PptA (4-oxalocrotonate tautomerase family)
MPLVHVNVWKRFRKEKAKTVIQDITEVFVNLDIPLHAVEVIVHEIQKSHWGLEENQHRRSSKISLPNGSTVLFATGL